MEEQKKRKTGLGIDVFFPPTPQERETALVKEEPAPAVSQPPVTEEEKPKPMSPKLRTPTPVKARVPKAERPTERKAAVQSEAVKLTVMTPQNYLDQLEELKRRERRRLSQKGEKNYREKVTVTKLVNEAIGEFLAKRGFIKGR